MAEAILRSALVGRGVDWPIWSAGLLEGGHPMVEEALAALGPDGGSMVGHLSRTLVAADVVAADIIFGLAREHVREVAVLVPEGWGRTFTLKEFVRRSQSFPPWFPDQGFAEWLAALHEGRERQELQGDSVEDDVADPIGGTPADFAATAQLLRGLCAKAGDSLSPKSAAT